MPNLWDTQNIWSPNSSDTTKTAVFWYQKFCHMFCSQRPCFGPYSNTDLNDAVKLWLIIGCHADALGVSYSRILIGPSKGAKTFYPTSDHQRIDTTTQVTKSVHLTKLFPCMNEVYIWTIQVLQQLFSLRRYKMHNKHCLHCLSDDRGKSATYFTF